MRATYSIAADRDGRWNAEALLRYGKRYSQKPREVHFRSTFGPFADNGDFLVPLTLAPAQVQGEDLEIGAVISKQLFRNISQVQRIYQIFAPSYGHQVQVVKFDVDGVAERRYEDRRGVACFFTGGVDSMYTVLQHREELTALVFLHGLDINERAAAFDKVTHGVRRAAQAIGLPLIEVETNAKLFADRFVHWDLYSGGPLMATALLLQNHFRKFYIAGARSLATLYANGTHPLLDPLWGTESLELENDAYAERWEKLAFLANSEIAQNHLRVCYENRGGAYNCCECTKCLWVMTILAAYGVLDRFQTFDKHLDLNSVRKLKFNSPQGRMSVEVVARAFARKDVDPDVLNAIYTIIKGWDPDFGDTNDGLGEWFANSWPTRKNYQD